MRPWRVAGWVAACGWIAWCAYYVFNPRPPFEFFADLGGYIETIGRMGAVATSPQALLSMANWQTWIDQPAFVLFPSGTLYSSLPIQLLLGDSFRTVKFVQVLQLSMAFSGAAWLYGLLFGRSAWRWFAGYAYAAMPFCTLAVRGEPDFGWVLALIPVALAANLALARRIGPWGFPLAGLLCAVAGGAFYAEHYVIVGVPLLLLTAVLLRNDGIALRPVHLILPALAFAAFPAYFVLPTFYGPHPLWFSESYQTGLRSEDVLSLFSASLFDQLAGVLRENAVSPDRALDASRSLPFALAAGVLLWALTIAAMAMSRASARRWWPIAAIGVVWTLLALGLNVPLLGPFVWGQVAAHPLLAGMRTPDRFGQFTAILVAVGGAYGAMRLAEGSSRRRAVALAACAIVAVGYTIFDVRENALAFGNMDVRLPSQREIDAKARSIGRRTATFAFTRGGSLFDPAPYTTLTPTIVSAWDVAARFPDDAGVELLGRAGIASIATSPVWTADTQLGMPQDMSAPVAASGLATPTLGAPGTTRLFAISEPRAPVARESLVCAAGGPAGFEIAATVRAFRDAALVHGFDRACGARVYADADPLDDALASRVSRWSGAEAFGRSGLPLPSPYAYEIERFALTQRWYRFGYFGDSLFAQPFATDGPTLSLPLAFSVTRSEAYALFVRAAGYGTLLTRDAAGNLASVRSHRVHGFRWLILPLGIFKPGAYDRTLNITRVAQPVDPLVVDVVAIAPLSLAQGHPRSDDAVVMPGQFSPPSRASDLAMLTVFPKPQIELTAAAQQVAVDARTAVGSFDGESGIRASEPRSRVSFVWNEPDGYYAVGSSAWLAGGDSSLAVVAPGGTVSQGYDPGVGPIPTAARGYLHLRRGDRVDVFMDTPGLAATGYNTLLELTAIAVAGDDAEPTDYDANGETWAYEAKNTLTFLAVAHSNGVLRAQSMPPIANAPGVAPPTILVAPEGTESTIGFRPTVFGGSVQARIAATGLFGTVRLQCGSHAQSTDMGTMSQHAIVATLSVPMERGDQCAFSARWRSFDFGLRGVSIHASGPYSERWETPQYLSAGSYVWSALRGKAPLLAIDGVPWAAGTPRQLAAGRHMLRLLRAALPIPPLLIHRSPAARDAVPPVRVLEATHLDDGYWFAGTGAGAVRGYACDLINTCFDTHADGPVVHAAPPALAAGLTITSFDAIACFALAGFGWLRRRRS